MSELTISTPIGVVLIAEMIPNEATVSKGMTSNLYTLRHDVVVYTTDSTPPIRIKGLFLISPNGTINQVEPETLLVWHTTLNEIVYSMNGYIEIHEDK